MSDLLPIVKAAHRLRVSRQRVHQLIQAGQLKAYRWDGRHWCIQSSDLEAYQSQSALDKF